MSGEYLPNTKYNFVDSFCMACGHHHIFKDDVLICDDKFCFCQKFSSQSSLVLTGHQKILDQLRKVTEKIKYMYEEIGEFQDMTNKEFVFAYWHYNHNFCTGMMLDVKTFYYLTDPEVIRRTRQKFVEKYTQYQSTNPVKVYGKMVKYGAIMEFVTQD